MDNILRLKEVIDQNEQLTKEDIDFYIRYDQICFFELGIEYFKKDLLRNLSRLSFCKIKFQLLDNYKTFDCCEDNITDINNLRLKSSLLDTSIYSNFVSISCSKKSFVALRGDFKVTIYKNGILTQTDKECFKAISYKEEEYYITRAGSLDSSHKWFRPFGFFRDFCIKNKLMVAIKENGNLCVFNLKTLNNNCIFQDRFCYKKVITDGFNFGGITEQGKLIIYDLTGEIKIEENGNFNLIESSYNYIVASNDEQLFVINGRNFLKHDFPKIIKIRCEKNFYAFMTNENRLYYSKEKFVNIKGKFLDFETSEKYIFVKKSEDKYIKVDNIL